MSILKKITFGTALLLLAGLSACNPDEVENPQPDLLAGGSAKTWQMTDATQNGLSSPNKACLVGDLYKFNADKTFVFDEGTDKCSESAPQTVSGQWELYNSTITMKETGNQTFVVLKLKSLTSGKMVTVLDNNGGPVIEYTFTAK
jgi:hypothetical protein